MKIAIAAPTHLPARRANTLQVMKMAQALAELGHTVRLAVPGLPAGRRLPAWEELAQLYGLQTPFPVEWLPSRSWLRRYDYGLQVVRWIRSWGANILYTRLPQAAALASQAGLPVILEVHDLPQGKLGPLAFRQFLQGRGARRLVVITQALAQDLHDNLGAPNQPPFTVIAADAVDLSRYQDLPEPTDARRLLVQHSPELARLETAKFTAGYTGHLYPGRGEELLFDLAEQLPEVIFLIVGGETAHVARLKQAAAARGLENFILAGFVPNAGLPIYQAACEALLLPYGTRVAASSGGDISRYFSPMKLFEYLASGRAILSSDLPVLHEVLNEKNARFIQPDDRQAWVESLKTLAANPDLYRRLGAQARQDAQRFTWENRARRIFEGL